MVGTDAAADSAATITPEKGSGTSERFAGIVAALKRERGAMRCCYDLWAKDHPRDAGLTLAFSIDEAGGITGVQIKGDSGDPFAMEAGGCIVDVALGIRYPVSPSGKMTTFEYDLGFKRHVAPVR
jgi:hypothetical protein